MSPCIPWAGHVTRSGYGRAKVKGEKVYAHRLAWERTFGEIDEDQCLVNDCGDRSCINPRHWSLAPLVWRAVKGGLHRWNDFRAAEE